MVKTKSGAQPKKSKYQHFDLTTYDVKKYLQSKVDVLISIMNQERKKDPNKTTIPPMRIHLFSTPISKKFAPFTILLAPTVAENFEIPYEEDIRESGEEIFLTPQKAYTGHKQKALLYPEFQKFVEVYGYTKGDIESLRTDYLKKELSITHAKIDKMYMFVDPRFNTLEGGAVNSLDVTRVVVLLDPIKVFHDMLSNPDEPKEEFEIQITLGDKKNENEFVYHIRRRRTRKKSATNADIMHEKDLTRAMQSSMR